MSKLTRPKTTRQFEHAGSRSAGHRLDVQEHKARRKTTYLALAAPESQSPARIFGDLVGHEYIHETGQWRLCDDPEEYGVYLQGEARRRDWYLSITQRNGIAVPMRRPATAMVLLTTTCAPWLSDWTASEFAANRNPRSKLAEVQSLWLETVIQLFEDSRHILGFALHADSDDLHFDLALSRQDGAGGRIGSAGLRLVGAWCVGTDRQLRAGATIHPDKRSQIRRAIANFRHRYGVEAVPLDVTLARALDDAADRAIGPALIPFREAYAASVPAMERNYVAARLAALEAEAAKLRSRLAEEPTLTPSLTSPPL